MFIVHKYPIQNFHDNPQKVDTILSMTSQSS
jgi:hypothetical protein